MFRRFKKSTPTEYPYDKLHEYLRQSVMRRWWIGPWLACCVLIGAIIAALMTWNPQAWTYILSGLIWGAIAGALFGLTLLLVHRLLVYSDEEQRLISEGVTFLIREQSSEAILTTMDTRAEIGVSGSQVRSLLPLFMLPLAVPLLLPYLSGNIQSFSAIYLFIGLSALLFVSFVLLRDLMRANIDTAIRHVAAEYRYTLTIRETPKVEHATVTAPNGQPKQLHHSRDAEVSSPSRHQQRRSAGSLKRRRQ